MKIISNRFYVTLMHLLGVFIVFAAPGPPSPVFKTPPTPPVVSVDDHIFYILIFTIFFGTFLVHKHHSKTKTPI